MPQLNIYIPTADLIPEILDEDAEALDQAVYNDYIILSLITPLELILLPAP
jgi:hypothetical protein